MRGVMRVFLMLVILGNCHDHSNEDLHRGNLPVPSLGVCSEMTALIQSALDMFLRRFITVGRLAVHWPDGKTQIYAGRSGPEASVVLRDRRTVWRLMLNPKLSLGEAYMDGGLVALGGSIHDVLEVVLANL
jgi:hypothetical protein